MNNEIAKFLDAVGEPGYALEVEAMHNRLEAFAGGLDRTAMACAVKTSEETIKQRDALLVELQHCAKVFRRYEQMHLLKCTDDATAKARSNGMLAARCEIAIAGAGGKS